MIFFKLFTSITIIISHVFSIENPTYQRAQVLMKQIDQDNNKDLQFLWENIGPFCKLMPENDFYRMKVENMEQLKKDITTFQYYISLDSKDFSIPLKTAIQKLVGDNIKTGLLQDALIILDQLQSCEQLGDEIQRASFQNENYLTVIKTLLIYINLYKKINPYTNLNLLYPIQFPNNFKLDNDRIPLICAISSKKFQLYMPNRGYVFGGCMINNQCKGLDCSSFASYCIDQKGSITTLHMEQIWNILKGNIITKDKNLLSLSKNFHAFSVDEKSLMQTGDLVIWRANRGIDGHVAIFKEWMNPEYSQFIGIDNCRTNDKKLEGVKERKYALIKKNFKTFVLRKSG